MRSFQQIPDWVTLEHQVAQLLSKQEIHGWHFDVNAARELECSLRKELWDLEAVLRNRFPFVAGAEFTPKRNNRTSGYVEGCSFTKLKDLNISSRDHIAWVLQTHEGWKPTTLTATGKPVIDEVILKEIGTPTATQFLQCLTINKTLGMISEGANAWLKLVTRHSRIHHHCSTATITHRCSHKRPNLAQVPSESQFRKLFTASPGMVMCGADLSGIELRLLGHYLSRYSTYFSDNLLNDDIHQVNADKIGISRRQVKTVTYAFLYGAGSEKIGHSFDPQLSTKQAKIKGKEIQEAFIAAIPGLDQLLSAVKAKGESGKINAIDGRPVVVGSPHKSLNCLLQASAAVIAKRWLLINHQQVQELNLNANQLAFVHDELQFETHPDHVNDLCSSLVLSAARAGEYYSCRIPIAAEAASGPNWGETH